MPKEEEKKGSFFLWFRFRVNHLQAKTVITGIAKSYFRSVALKNKKK